MDYVNPELVAGVGIIHPPRKYPHTQPRDRCVGTGEDNGVPVLTPQGRATVKVTNSQGNVSFVSAHAFKNRRVRASQERAQQPQRPTMPDVVRYAAIIGYTGDVGS